MKVYNSATVISYAPSDQSGQGLHHDITCCMPSWNGGPAHRDCVFVEGGGIDGNGFGGLLATRVCLLFTFGHHGKMYECALVGWYLPVRNALDETTGMWIVAPEMDQQGQWVCAMISLDAVLRLAHLIAVYGEDVLLVDFHYTDTLNTFQAYYVNKYIDYHAHCLAF